MQGTAEIGPLAARNHSPNKPVMVGLLPDPGEFPRAYGKTSRRVLVVDHEPLIRWSLAEILSDAGHTVIVAGDGAAALDVVTSDPPFDVILLDGDLPEAADLSLLSGLHLLAPEARIVLMTAFGSPALERNAVSLGACRVIEKPFDMADLPSLVG